MGKWTANHTDDVLRSKVSAMVTGAIRRAALEDPQAPPLSYNEFVNELDVGDSFTTTLMDILVKEVTERRKRTPADRHYISEQTAKSLRQLTDALNIYRGRPARSWTVRRPHGHAVRLGSDFVMSADTDEDEFDNMMDEGLSVEGSAMTSSELFQAMQANPLRREPSRLTSVTPDEEPSRAQSPAPGALASTSRRGNWGLIPATTTANTTRMPSTLRRNVRSRTSDFTDFSRRHRSSLRASLATRGEAELPELDARADRWSTLDPDNGATRRFFALNHLRRRNQARREASGNMGSVDTSGDEDFSAFRAAVEGPGAPGPSSLAEGSSSGATAGWSSAPPEMYISPRAIMMPTGGPGGEAVLRFPGGHEMPMVSSYEEPAAYPTPGSSVDNEHLA